MKPSSRLSVQSNKYRQCEVCECFKARHGLSKWCSRHAEKARLHGHPLGVEIQKKWFTNHLRVVRQLFLARCPRGGERGRKDPAVVEAIDIVKRILTPGEQPERKLNGTDISGRKHTKSPEWHAWNERRILQLVKPREVLITVLAVWWFSHTDQKKLPDDVRLDYALARAVFKLVTRPIVASWWNHQDNRQEKWRREAGAGAASIIGHRLRQELVPFWVRILPALEDLTRQQVNQATPATWKQEVLRSPIAKAAWITPPPKGSRMEKLMNAPINIITNNKEIQMSYNDETPRTDGDVQVRVEKFQYAGPDVPPLAWNYEGDDSDAHVQHANPSSHQPPDHTQAAADARSSATIQGLTLAPKPNYVKPTPAIVQQFAEQDAEQEKATVAPQDEPSEADLDAIAAEFKWSRLSPIGRCRTLEVAYQRRSKR